MGANDIGYSKEQVNQLIDGMSEVVAMVEGTSAEVKSVLTKLTDPELFKESKQTEKIQETCNTCETLLQRIEEAITAAKGKVQLVCDKVGLSLKKREMSMEEQNAVLSKVSKQAEA